MLVTSLVAGTTSLEANLTNLNVGITPSDLSCSYAILQYMNSTINTYSFYNSTYTLQTNNLIALDWRIGRQSCNEARLDPTHFACKSNSDCVDFDPTVKGYLCNCSIGFQGNPYIGCKGWLPKLTRNILLYFIYSQFLTKKILLLYWFWGRY